MVLLLGLSRLVISALFSAVRSAHVKDPARLSRRGGGHAFFKHNVSSLFFILYHIAAVKSMRIYRDDMPPCAVRQDRQKDE